MTPIKTIAAWMTERQLDLAKLVAAAGLERRVVEAIVQGRYTPSPQQRSRNLRKSPLRTSRAIHREDPGATLGGSLLDGQLTSRF